MEDKAPIADSPVNNFLVIQARLLQAILSCNSCNSTIINALLHYIWYCKSEHNHTNLTCSIQPKKLRLNPIFYMVNPKTYIVNPNSYMVNPKSNINFYKLL